MMKTMNVAAAALLILIATGASGQGKNCEELKSEIAAKIEANGVPSYTLTIVDAGASHEGKIVGSCGGNTKRIAYVRGGAASAPAPEATPEPAAPAAE